MGFCINCGTRLGTGAIPPPPPPPRKRVNIKAIVSTVLPLVIAAVTLFGVLSRDEAEAAVIYEPPLAAGRNPFTSPIDVAAASVGSTIPTPTASPASTGTPSPGATTGPSIRPGNFGGTGFTTVCDREQLIRQLQANPAALAAWAAVHGLAPEAVPKYIRGLRPASFTEGTRATNHRLKDGKAVPFQSIQAAGTAVLIDDAGRPVARCRCGNPLLEPKPVGAGKCSGCPKNYKPPALLPRGQVPPTVVAVNPPPATGTSSSTPPPTSSPGTGTVTGSPAGRWIVTVNEKVSGPSTCTADKGDVFNVTVRGSTIIFSEENSTVILEAPLRADGRFEGSKSGEGYTLSWSGRFTGNRIVDGRSSLNAGSTECVFRWEAERRPFG